MDNQYTALLAAERRGRAFIARLKPAAGDVLLATVADDADGHALLAACRLARRLGAGASARLVGPTAATGVGRILADSSQRQGILSNDRGDGSDSAVLIRGGRRLAAGAVPDANEAWRTLLDEAAPFVKPAAGLPAMSCADCRDIDRRAIQDFLVPGVCLMENAAIAAAIVAMDMLPAAKPSVLIVAGGGNNGGDGFAMARGLSDMGVAVDIALCKSPDRLSGDAAVNYRLLEAHPSVRTHRCDSTLHPLPPLLAKASVIVDALLGTGFKGLPSPLFHAAIDAVNAAGAPVLALDLPSGLDGDTGEVADVAVRADRTIAFAAVKHGLVKGKGPEYAGRLYLGDIGAPTAAFPEYWPA